MTNFGILFIKSRGKPITYKGSSLYLIDSFDIRKQQFVKIRFLHVQSIWRQGIYLGTEGRFIVNNQIFQKSIILWHDTAPKDVTIEIRSSNRLLTIKNVWDSGNGVVHSGHSGAAMKISKTDNLYTYSCNDGNDDEDFDDLVFTLELLK